MVPFPSHQTESTGTNALERKNDAIMAKPTASERGTKSDRDARHEEGRHEHGDHDSMEQSRHDHLAARVEHGARERCSARQVGVDVFDRHRGFVDEDADRRAKPPSVMMLIVCPAPQSATTAASSANGS